MIAPEEQDMRNGFAIDEPFDAFEVHAVQRCIASDGTDFWETIDDWDGDSHIDADVIFTVYGHRPNAGVIAIADFGDPDTAFNVASALAKTPIVPIWNYLP